jgi:hypothetical protein
MITRNQSEIRGTVHWITGCAAQLDRPAVSMAALIRGARGQGQRWRDGWLHGGAAVSVRWKCICFCSVQCTALYMQWSTALRGPPLPFPCRARALGDAVVLCVEGPAAKLVAVFGLVGRRRASNALLVTPWFEIFLNLCCDDLDLVHVHVHEWKWVACSPEQGVKSNKTVR